MFRIYFFGGIDVWTRIGFTEEMDLPELGDQIDRYGPLRPNEYIIYEG